MRCRALGVGVDVSLGVRIWYLWSSLHPSKMSTYVSQHLNVPDLMSDGQTSRFRSFGTDASAGKQKRKVTEGRKRVANQR